MVNLHISTDPEWQWVYKAILYGVGEEFPQADPAQLRAMGDELFSFSKTLLSGVPSIHTLAAQVPSKIDGTVADAFAQFAANLVGKVPSGANISTTLGNSAYDFALDAEKTQYNIVIAMFNQLWEIFIALASGFPELVPGFLKMGSEIVTRLISKLKSKVLRAIAHLAFAALNEGFDELLEGLAAQSLQMIEGNRKKLDVHDLLMDFAAGAFIGAFASGFQSIAGKWFPKLEHSALGKGVIEGLGEMGGEGIFSRITGGDFNPGATLTSSMIGGMSLHSGDNAWGTGHPDHSSAL